MTDATKVSRKLDALLAGQAAAAGRLDELDEALRDVVVAVAKLVPILGTHREMLQRILNAAAGESASGSELAEALRHIEAVIGTMTEVQARTNRALVGLPDAIEDATARGVQLA